MTTTCYNAPVPRARLIQTKNGPQLVRTAPGQTKKATAASAAARSTRTSRRRVSTAPSVDKVRADVLALLRANPDLAPRNAEEKALTAPTGVAGISVTPPGPSDVSQPSSPGVKPRSRPAAAAGADLRYGSKDRKRFPTAVQA